MSGDSTFPPAELVDECIRVRAWRTQDADDLFDAARTSQSTLGRWLDWCHADYSRTDACAWIDRCQLDWKSGEQYAFAILELQTGELLGGVGLNQRNREQRSANLGYWVRQSRHGEGTATRAAGLVARFGFASLGLSRIEIVALPDNHASLRVAGKLGAQFEAMAPRRLWLQGQARDAAVYGITPADLR